MLETFRNPLYIYIYVQIGPKHREKYLTESNTKISGPVVSNISASCFPYPSKLDIVGSQRSWWILQCFHQLMGFSSMVLQFLGIYGWNFWWSFNHHRNSEFSHETWWFSIVMLNYQRVFDWMLCGFWSLLWCASKVNKWIPELSLGLSPA